MSDRPRPDPADIALAIAIDGDRLLVSRRPAGAHLEGLWEFPGGKVEAGEEPAAAARRELAEETGIEAGDLEPLCVFVHEYPDRSLRLHAFVARRPGARAEPGGRWAWKALDELQSLQTPEANMRILRALRRRVQ